MINNNIFYSHLEGVLASSHANFYCKDKSGKYIDANNLQVKRCGSRTYDNLIGSTDYDLIWREHAHTLIANDRHVIHANQSFIVKEPVNKLNNYLSYKSPLLNRKGKIIGIFGLSYLLNDITDIASILNDISMLGGPHGSNVTNELLRQHYQSKFNLTKQQTECLIQLKLGKTTKQVAKTLSLSPRTVEHYIEAIKIKFNCSTKYELIEKINLNNTR